MNVTAVGLGLMGGSFALALQEKDLAKVIFGVDKKQEHSKVALEKGIIQKCISFEEALSKSQVIILATPVDTLMELVPAVLDQISNDQLLIDLGSTKNRLCQEVRNHPMRSRYVAAHPMAGTENTGPDAAFAGLFDGAINVVCDQEFTEYSALKLALNLFETIGMTTLFMGAEDHDKHVAYISHLSHISSFMLGLTVLNKEKDEKNITNLAGSGFESTVRLAKSSPEMWAPIFAQNRDYVSRALAEYIEQLKSFKEMIDSSDISAMSKAMKRANDIRRVLSKK